RLLQLLPGEYDEPITCNLFPIDSVELYEYEALSYVWGQVNNSSIIHVNDWEMLITENLEVALRSLRLEHEPRLLWIDAICINQSSVTEKTSQVAKMGDIYKAAKRVLVFLGPE
ncbi:HET-domain-containing protein, partial [Polyplosphaeria fusca]